MFEKLEFLSNPATLRFARAGYYESMRDSWRPPRGFESSYSSSSGPAYAHPPPLRYDRSYGPVPLERDHVRAPPPAPRPWANNPAPPSDPASSRPYVFGQASDSYRPGEPSRGAGADSYRPRDFSFRAQNGPRPTPNFSQGPYNQVAGRQARSKADERHTRNAGAFGPPGEDRRPDHKPYRSEGRQFQPKPKTSERPLLQIQRSPTPEQLNGMKGEQQRLRFKTGDVSSSDEEAGAVNVSKSESDEDSERPRKKVMIEAPSKSADASETPKWTNPDPYTSLPPPEAPVKKTDFIGMIRKAKAETGKDTVLLNNERDFISLDADEATTRSPLSKDFPLENASDIGTMKRDALKTDRYYAKNFDQVPSHTNGVSDAQRLFLGNLPLMTSETDLRSFFGHFPTGEITAIKDGTRRPTGCAYVEVLGSGEAERAVSELNGRRLANRKISVQFTRLSTPPKNNSENIEGQNGNIPEKNYARNVLADYKDPANYQPQKAFGSTSSYIPSNNYEIPPPPPPEFEDSDGQQEIPPPPPPPPPPPSPSASVGKREETPKAPEHVVSGWTVANLNPTAGPGSLPSLPPGPRDLLPSDLFSKNKPQPPQVPSPESKQERPLRLKPAPRQSIMPGMKRKREEVPKGQGDIEPDWRGSDTPWHTDEVHQNSSMLLHEKLHEEIRDFYDYARPRDFEHHMRMDLVNRFQVFVDKVSRGSQVRFFGSFASGIYLPNADMDLVVLSKGFLSTGRSHTFSTKKSLRSFAENLKFSIIPRPGTINPILKAKVPIVKFVDRHTGLRVDVSFDNDTGLVANETYNLWKSRFPAMPVITTMVKHFLAMRGLHEVSSGGLGGFSVTCLVVSLMQHLPELQKNSMDRSTQYGDLFMLFLDLYGTKFNTTVTGIRLDPPEYFQKSTEHRIRFNPRREWSLCIVDPNKSDNDISSGSHSIRTILTQFGETFETLRKQRSTCSQRDCVLGPIFAGNYSVFDDQRLHLYTLYQKARHP